MAKTASKKVTATKAGLLESAKAILMEHGYAGLSTRRVAEAAGQPMSQIQYHFGSKQGLLLALFEHMNEGLVERQRQMYDDPALKLSEQWDLACDYLEQDIVSGYVRVLHEQMAASWSSPELRTLVANGLQEWIELIRGVASEAERRFGRIGPFTADEIAALVGAVFIGAESAILIGVTAERNPIRSGLRRCGDLIRIAEAGQPRPAAAT